MFEHVRAFKILNTNDIHNDAGIEKPNLAVAPALKRHRFAYHDYFKLDGESNALPTSSLLLSFAHLHNRPSRWASSTTLSDSGHKPFGSALERRIMVSPPTVFRPVGVDHFHGQD